MKSNCLYNYDREPSTVKGKCTHLITHRKQKSVVLHCETLSQSSCLQNKNCKYNKPDTKYVNPSSNPNACTHLGEFGFDPITVQTCFQLSSENECMRFSGTCKWNKPKLPNSETYTNLVHGSILIILVLIVFLCCIGLCCLWKNNNNNEKVTEPEVQGQTTQRDSVASIPNGLDNP